MLSKTNVPSLREAQKALELMSLSLATVVPTPALKLVSSSFGISKQLSSELSKNSITYHVYGWLMKIASQIILQRSAGEKDGPDPDIRFLPSIVLGFRHLSDARIE